MFLGELRHALNQLLGSGCDFLLGDRRYSDLHRPGWGLQTDRYSDDPVVA